MKRRVRRLVHIAGIAAVTAVTAVANLAGCLYVPAVNERPRARIEETTQGPYNVGDPITLSAEKSTDDGDAVALRAAWQARVCDESGASCELLDLTASGSGIFTPVTLTAEQKGEIQVQLTVTDAEGASETVDTRIVIGNQDPVIETQVTGFPDPGPSGGHVLGLPVEIAAMASDPDGDPIELTWQAFPPLGAGSNPDDVVFEPTDGSATTYRLIGDVPGVWEVHVTADDGAGGTAESVEMVLLAPDGPPCITATDPTTSGTETVVLDATRRFSVLTVADALDPYPRPADANELVGQADFTWWLASPASGGELVELVGHDLAEVVLDPDLYAPGDHLTLRVEASDRVARTLPCDPADPVCSINGDSCVQRLSWEVEVR